MSVRVRKFCLCGFKPERNVADEEAARALVSVFRLEHSGTGHGPTDQQGYRLAVARNALSDCAKEVGPIIAAINRAQQTDGRRTHEWVNKFGLVFCSVCLVVRSETEGDCKGAALVLYRDAVPVLVRKKSGNRE